MNTPKNHSFRRRQPHPIVCISDEVRLAVSKIIRAFSFVDKSYGLNLWSTPHDMQHDWELMRANDDLSRIALELLDRDRRIVFAYEVKFTEGQTQGTVPDSARGFELPMINRSRIRGHRLVVGRQGRDAVYRHLLRAHWTPSEVLKRPSVSRYESGHTAKITGDRQKGEFLVHDDDRHNLVVTQTGAQFAFARDLTTRNDGIFLHRQFAEGVHDFPLGLKLNAVIVTTPRGLQARAIRAA